MILEFRNWGKSLTQKSGTGVFHWMCQTVKLGWSFWFCITSKIFFPGFDFFFLSNIQLSESSHRFGFCHVTAFMDYQKQLLDDEVYTSKNTEFKLTSRNRLATLQREAFAVCHPLWVQREQWLRVKQICTYLPFCCVQPVVCDKMRVWLSQSCMASVASPGKPEKLPCPLRRNPEPWAL